MTALLLGLLGPVVLPVVGTAALALARRDRGPLLVGFKVGLCFGAILTFVIGLGLSLASRRLLWQAFGLCAVHVGTFVALERLRVRAMARALAAAARLLGGTAAPGQNAVAGTRDGVRSTFHLWRGEKNGTRDTSVEATAAASPLELVLRPHRLADRAREAAGVALDVTTGDRAFDDAFVVEGAPRDVLLRLLDADTRSQLLALHPVTLRIAGARVTLDKVGWLLDERRISAAIDVTCRTAAGVGPAFAQADEALLDRGGPYRAEWDTKAVREAQAQRREDLRALHETRARRARLWRRVGVTAALAAVVGLALLWLAVVVLGA